jgi:hypothetical protein
LRTAGFESCIVRCPSSIDLDPLRWFFEHPERAGARGFVSEVLGLALAPPRRTGDVEMLMEPDRARLRLALVAACGCEREWRKLHGSHLSPDERLMAVMVWRSRRHERLFTRLRERRRELEAERKAAAEHVGGGTHPALAAALGLGSASTALKAIGIYRLPDTSKLFPDYSKLLPSFPDPAVNEAARLVRRMYSDPSPLVVNQTGGPNSII